MSNLTHLESRFNLIKDEIPTAVNLRAYRCLSWLKKAKASEEDLDVRFISLWIAFNAIYAKDLTFVESDKSAFRQFLHLINLRAGDELYRLTWEKYPEEYSGLS